MDTWYQGASTPEPQETRSLSGRLGSPCRAEPPAKPPSSGPRPLPPPRLARHPVVSRLSSRAERGICFTRPGGTIHRAPLRASIFKFLISSFAFRPPPHHHFERSRPTFSSAFAPANASACAERNLSSSFLNPPSSAPSIRPPAESPAY